MAVTVGGSPITPSQAADLRTALGIPETEITARLTSITGTDDAIFLRSGTPNLVAASVIADFTGAGAPANAPDAFVVGDWTATAGNEQIAINITTLPADNGSAILVLQYRLNGGTAVTMTGTGTGERTIGGLTNGTSYDVEIRAVNANGSGAWSDIKTRTPSTVPAAFTAGMWTATAGEESIVVNITSLPSDGGSAITALEYRLDGGTAVALTGTGTGERTITGLTAAVEYDVELRVVNANGNGAWGDLKSATPTAAATLEWVASPTVYNTAVPSTTHVIDVPSGAQVGDYLVLALPHWAGEPPTSIVASNGQSLSVLAQYSSASEIGTISGVIISGTVPTTVTVTATSSTEMRGHLQLARGVSAVAGTVLNGNSGSARTNLTYATDATDALVMTLYSTTGSTARVLTAYTPAGGSGTAHAKWSNAVYGVATGIHSGSTGTNNAAVTWSESDAAGGRWLSLALKA